MKLKSRLVVHDADSPHGRQQLILWLERQARFLRRNSPRKLAKCFTARLFLDEDNTMLTERGA